jgi:hypothetical protein
VEKAKATVTAHKRIETIREVRRFKAISVQVDMNQIKEEEIRKIGASKWIQSDEDGK